YYADDLAGNVTLPKSAERSRLVEAWNAALERLAADTGLSEGDRLVTLHAEVALAKLDDSKAPTADALQRRVRDEAARAERDTRDPYSRHADGSDAYELRPER